MIKIKKINFIIIVSLAIIGGTCTAGEIKKNKYIDGYSPITSMESRIHEGIPNGVNNEWKQSPRIENIKKPVGWNAVGLWGQVYLEEGYDYPQNTGIEISDFKMYGYEDGKWNEIIHAIPNGAWYKEDFSNDENMYWSDKIKIDIKNKSAIIKMDKDTTGYNFHPFSDQVKINDVEYIISQMKVRLVKWDENGVNDIEKARFVANVGGDWWRDIGIIFDGEWTNNKGIVQGQFRKITSDWKVCYSTNLPKELYYKELDFNNEFQIYNLNK